MRQSALSSMADQSYRYGGNNSLATGDFIVNLGGGTQYTSLKKDQSQRSSQDSVPSMSQGVNSGPAGNTQQYLLLAGGLLLLVLLLKKLKKK
ncbi:hypothetical protein [Janthinobacterium sp. B9-8]|uniref:hypothetical protein n=1 Tax=Janthinobacterium sp. B9-8 TaxID=1236179 RepID=UPI0018D23067|nr:hypothetical protein [Janthinobacterium sp. B9-8]